MYSFWNSYDVLVKEKLKVKIPKLSTRHQMWDFTSALFATMQFTIGHSFPKHGE